MEPVLSSFYPFQLGIAAFQAAIFEGQVYHNCLFLPQDPSSPAALSFPFSNKQPPANILGGFLLCARMTTPPIMAYWQQAVVPPAEKGHQPLWVRPFFTGVVGFQQL
ncbi:MAG: hypothetical protein FWD72_05835 [Eggerthellaceae bacterium]|nr:hypothetical protein [Eggerthellaceae bacterium]